MNYLKDKSCYLCGAIKDLSDDGISWRDHITPKLLGYGLIVYDPCKKNDNMAEIGEAKKNFTNIIMKEDWKKIKEEFWPIVRWDLRSVDKSDFIIFDYNPEVSTVGSIHELVVANLEKKPILLKYNKNQLEKFNPWITIFIKEHNFFTNWDDMFTYLDKINNGELDTSFWI
jgi:hypothetical protein